LKYLLFFVIKVYQSIIPRRFRCTCLFKESCSNHVYRITKESGFTAGTKAFRFRLKNCRPNYYLIEEKGKTLLITAENEIVEEQYINDEILIKNRLAD